MAAKLAQRFENTKKKPYFFIGRIGKQADAIPTTPTKLTKFTSGLRPATLNG